MISSCDHQRKLLSYFTLFFFIPSLRNLVRILQGQSISMRARHSSSAPQAHGAKSYHFEHCSPREFWSHIPQGSRTHKEPGSRRRGCHPRVALNCRAHPLACSRLVLHRQAPHARPGVPIQGGRFLKGKITEMRFINQQEALLL